MAETKYTKEKIEEILKEHNFGIIGTIENAKTKIDCMDNEGYKYQIRLSSLLKGFKPSKFGNGNEFTMENILLFQEKNKTQIKFLKENKYINNSTKMKVVCTKCGKEDFKNWVEIQQKDTCSYCCKNPTKVSFETSIAGKRPELVKFFKNPKDAEGITVMSDKKVKLKCPDCGHEKEMTAGKLTERRFACTKCGDGISIPEKFTGNVLEQLNLDFKREKTFEWSKKYRYDFYLEKEKMIIETHGLQHYKEKNGFFKKTLQEQQKIDKEKKELALKNGIKKYVEINCSTITIESIKKETIKELGQHLDLSKVDWKKAMTNTRNSIMVKICNYYKENKGMKIKEMIENLPYSKSSVLKYLKIGAELGLCDYKRTLNQHGKIWTKKE